MPIQIHTVGDLLTVLDSVSELRDNVAEIESNIARMGATPERLRALEKRKNELATFLREPLLVARD